MRRSVSPVLAAIAAFACAAPASAATPRAAPHEVVVHYRSGHPRVLKVKDPTKAIRALTKSANVRYAVPNLIAHASGFVPNDPGRGTKPAGWTSVQWNFAGPWGVNAPDAWQHLIDAKRPGGRGVIVAVLDTGVAYRQAQGYLKSPDLSTQRIVRGYDFVSHDRYPYDKNGHGTHVASTIAESTNNGIGLTGLAYGAKIMPVRVLDDAGEGDISIIARGIRYAADHGAQVINLSLEFSVDVRAAEVPELIDAVNYAHDKGAVLVGASGNESYPLVAYPAKAHNVIAVGSTTEHGCLSDFSNTGDGLDVVAPGGGPDAALDGDPNCHPDQPSGHDIYQVTLEGRYHDHFGIPGDYEGTSMAAPHVSAIAALVIASGVLGAKPTPDQVTRRIETTVRDLGPAGYDRRYGFGLVNAAAATDPAVPVAATDPVETGNTSR